MRQRDENFPDNGFEAWGGYMHAKITKLEEQFSSRALKEECLSNIFSGISIYVNGFTIPSADELKVLMSKNGGVYHTYPKSEDYIIASNLPDTKVKNMTLCKVVKPEWITDSLEANKLLDYRNYLLYKNSRTQKQLNFQRVDRIKYICDSTPVTINNDSCSIPNIDTDDNKCVINNTFLNKTQFHINSEQSIGLITNPRNKISPKKPQPIKTASDPNFISEFYNNSRLHHISQLGAYFKQYVNDLREKHDFSFTACKEIKNRIMLLGANSPKLSFVSGKTIMHIDMDCFFVSVGLRNRQDLQGKPVAVTHSKGGKPVSKRPGVDRNTEFNLYKQKQTNKLTKLINRSYEDIDIETRIDGITDEDGKYGSMSEIASCSYEARAKGVGNGMFMGKALKLCPDLQTIPYDFEGYKEVAHTLYNTVAQYTLNIEAVSCDEMYVDCTDLLKNINVCVQDFATVLRNEIRNKTGCPCSTGFGGNRLQARLATKKAKPDGQFFLTNDLVEDFMFSIELKDLPGVGQQIAQKLETLGHTTCGSLQNLTLAYLKCQLGNKTGAQLFDQCRGNDFNPLIFHTVRKSVSAEVNYGIRFENKEQCIDFLKQLSAEVHTRMHQFKVLGKCITLKLMVRAEEAPVETAKFMGHGFCNVINKSSSLYTATNDIDIITKEVLGIFKKQNVNPTEMRGVGIQVTKLELLNKTNKGSLSKFLCNTLVKPEIKLATKVETKHVESIKQISRVKELNVVNNQNNETVTSPKKNVAKNLAKPRGRPRKTLGIHKSNSNKYCNTLYQEQKFTKNTPPKIPIVIYENKEIKEEQPEGLRGLSWEKVRGLVRAWLDNGQKPLPCDTKLIASYLIDMVIKKELEKVSVLVNFLKRRAVEVDMNEWVEVYKHIEEEVQNTMLLIYGKRLYID